MESYCKYIACSLLYLWYTCACGQSYTIPLKVKAGNLSYLNVTIDGVTGEFIFDTGASSIVINASMFNQLQRRGKVPHHAIVGNTYVTIADGSIVTATLARLQNFEVGNLHLDEVEVLIMPGSDAPLLIGQSFFRNFGKLTIDNANNLLLLEGQMMTTAILKEIRFVKCHYKIAHMKDIQQLINDFAQGISEDPKIPPQRAIDNVASGITIRYFDTNDFTIVKDICRKIEQEYTAKVNIQNMLPNFNYQPIPRYIEIWFKN